MIATPSSIYYPALYAHIGSTLNFAENGGFTLLVRRKIFIVMVCLIGLGVAGLASYTIFGDRSAVPQTPHIRQGQAGLANTVAALGRIEPQNEIINLGAGSAPDRLETLFVGRGDLVKKDQVLGYLGGYGEQLAQRDVFQAQREEASSRLNAEITVNLARIEAAEVHQKQILELSPPRIAAQEATIAGLEAKLANDKDILDSQEQLMSHGVGTRRLTKDNQTTVQQTEANLTVARERLSELTRQFQLDQVDAEVQIRLARATLERMRAEFPIASLDRQIKLAEARAKRLTLFAPTDGRILNIRVKPGEEIGSGPILTMGDTGHMRVVAEVYETDVPQVRIDQHATVSSRALSKPITGRVVRIGNMVFKNDVLNVDPAARADARVVEVWIELDDAALVERMTNLTVDVLITTSAADTADSRSVTP
jgi:HlyD family secretion protein